LRPLVPGVRRALTKPIVTAPALGILAQAGSSGPCLQRQSRRHGCRHISQERCGHMTLLPGSDRRRSWWLRHGSWERSAGGRKVASSSISPISAVQQLPLHPFASHRRYSADGRNWSASPLKTTAQFISSGQSSWKEPAAIDRGGRA